MSLISKEQRFYAFDSIYNFRDFGAYEGHEGRAIKPRKLFRSAHLHNLNDDDHAHISGLDIGAIIDLRHGPERARQPSRLPSNDPDIYNYPDLPQSLGDKLAPHESFVQQDLQKADDARNYMIKSYALRPDDPGFQKIFGESLRILAQDRPDNKSGILIHCAAGKDRTGTLCALIKGVLGVSIDDIMADYMLTMEAVDIAAIIKPAAKMSSKRYGRRIDPEMLMPMFVVAPEYLQASLDRIGAVEPYIINKLGLSRDEITAIRANYLSD